MIPRESTPRVLLFEASISAAACRSYQAIARFAKTAGWNLQTIEYDIPDAMLKARALNKSPDIAELVDLWRPKGVIIECAGRLPTLPLKKFGRIPVALLDCPQDFASSRVGCVCSDSAGIGKVAARELLPMGFDHYAVMPHPSRTDWSCRRATEFRRLIDLAGRECRILDVSSGSQSDMGRFLREIARQIQTLPHPCGIFAVNDEMAQIVVTACEMSGLNIPDDVAIVGVDNDERFCENTAVTLSSIVLDNDEIGTETAHLLDDMMNGRRRKGATVVCGAVRLVRRMSSSRLQVPDNRMKKAIEYIRLNACKGVTPHAVAREMGCSRRFADSRFHLLLGHTVQEEIRMMRLEQVKTLLADKSVELSEIPARCGYSSMSDLCRDFKKRTGQTLRGWRN